MTMLGRVETFLRAGPVDEPRNEQGEWTSGGGGGDDEATGAIKEFLTFYSNARPIPQGWTTTPDRLLLEHGQAFPTNDATYTGKREQEKACYMNAAKMVLDSSADSGLTYVEGYVRVHGVPIEHAWVVDKTGHVIDPMIKLDTKVAVDGYFGIPFATDYVRTTALRTGMWGILSASSNRLLFEKGLPKNAIAKVRVMKYSPDQPRDHGRFARVGGEMNDDPPGGASYFSPTEQKFITHPDATNHRQLAHKLGYSNDETPVWDDQLVRVNYSGDKNELNVSGHAAGIRRLLGHVRSRLPSETRIFWDTPNANGEGHLSHFMLSTVKVSGEAAGWGGYAATGPPNAPMEEDVPQKERKRKPDPPDTLDTTVQAPVSDPFTKIDTFLRKYNADEPRDEKGEWAATGAVHEHLPHEYQKKPKNWYKMRHAHGNDGAHTHVGEGRLATDHPGRDQLAEQQKLRKFLSSSDESTVEHGELKPNDDDKLPRDDKSTKRQPVHPTSTFAPVLRTVSRFLKFETITGPGEALGQGEVTANMSPGNPRKKGALADVEEFLKYRPDQARDEKGQFAYEGGGARRMERIDREGHSLLVEAKAAEPHVSRDIREISQGQNMGSKMEGYPDFVIKSEASLQRKMREIAKDNPDFSPAEVRAMTRDTLRYTIVYHEGTYTTQVRNTIKELEARGYTFTNGKVNGDLAIKNGWRKGNNYKGINTNLRSPNGTMLELQFHTPKSWHVKQYESHPLYEELRTLDHKKGAATIRARLSRRIHDMFDAIVHPPDSHTIGTLTEYA